jgi:hypothetical protein
LYRGDGPARPHTYCKDREQLVAALHRTDNAHQAARKALLHEGDYVIRDERVSTDRIHRLYRRRERYTREAGRETLGFARAVTDLATTDLLTLRLGYITGSAPPRHFQLFMAPDEQVVVACLAVAR